MSCVTYNRVLNDCGLSRDISFEQGELNGGLEEQTGMLISHNLIITALIIMKCYSNCLHRACIQV